MKKISISIAIISLLFACNNSSTNKNDETNELRIKDDKLTGFLLSGIYFFNGYGGAPAVYDMIKSSSNHEPHTKEFSEELDKNYSELMIYPFGAEEGESSKETLEEFWDVKDKAMFMETLNYLKKSGHHNEFIIYKKMIDENGGETADIAKAGANKDEEVKGKLEFIKNNYAAISKTGIKAWDYARYVNNVCLGYSAGYITKEEGEKFIADVLIETRALYSNWNDYYNDFNMGLKYSGIDKENEAQYEKTAKEMMEGDYSIYTYLPLK